MDQSTPPVLRGFDSYEVRLGDELRGQRATRGKSLLDVQRDLRIRAAYIDAIENCDPSVMPNKGFVAGYVRAYARYLDQNPDEVYARFCAESGFSGGGETRGRTAATADASFSRSHFAAPVGRASRVGLGVSLSGVFSIAVVAGLVGGLGYGGWMLLQEIQRVEFAPSNDAPEAAAAPGGIALPTVTLSALAETPAPRDAGRDEALAALYAPTEPAPPALALRDGPIAAIDPDSVGVFAGREAEAEDVAVAAAETDAPDHPGLAADAAGPAPVAEAQETRTADAEAAPASPSQPTRVAATQRTGVWIVTSEPAWLRVRLADGSTLVQRIFQPGDRYEMPENLRGARMRAGNAGAVFIEVDGVLHGPLGAPGGVVKEVALAPDAVRAAYAVASADLPAAASEPGLRAEAQLKLD